MASKNDSINELIKSMSKFSWAMSMFGISQIANAFTLNLSREDQKQRTGTVGCFNNAALAVHNNLDEPLKSAFLIGDRIQTAAADLFYDFFSLNSFSSRNLSRSVFDILWRSSEFARLLFPGHENPTALQEFKNKIEVFSLFEYVDELLPPVAERSLNRMIQSIGSLDTFSSIWAMEGIGHYYTEKIFSVIRFPEHLLSSEAVGNLPENTYIPLHAGMGLSLSRKCLENINGAASDEEIVELINYYIELCRKNSKSGYAGIMFETMGLITRNLYPHLLLRIDRGLKQFDKDYSEYFWHGAGRAMYFAPTGLASFWDENWSSIQAVKNEPPHNSGQLNALTGWLFALTLVNIRQPEIVAACLKAHQHLFANPETAAEGISAGLLVWQYSAAETSYIDAFLSYASFDNNSESFLDWYLQLRKAIVQRLNKQRINFEKEFQPERLFRSCQIQITNAVIKNEAYF